MAPPAPIPGSSATGDEAAARLARPDLDMHDTTCSSVDFLSFATALDLTEPEVAPEVGTTVDYFRIVRVLGEGGMGRVLLARDTRLGRLVALKVLRPDRMDEERATKLMDEARVTARLSHPHIVTIHAVGKLGSAPYLALEYLDGETLRKRMQHTPLATGEVLRVGLAVARALEAAHAAGVTHCDLKPENVVLPDDGRLRVVDFGLAAVVDAEEVPAGRATLVAGTPGYMAPERWLGERPAPPSDVWSLGVLLFELVAGHRPFEATRADRRPLYLRVMDENARPRLEGADPELGLLVQACLKTDAAGRPTAGQVAQRIERLLHREELAGRSEEAPFRGLLAFEERHAGWFFGRDAEIDLLLERLRSATVLPVVGPSGAGKSSLVQAGLVPRLRERGPWTVVQLRPGSQPLTSLAARLFGVLTTDEAHAAGMPDRSEIDRMAAQLRIQPRLANLQLHRLAEQTGQRVLLFVDQLEEIATQGVEPAEAEVFLEAIGTAADPIDDMVRVVFTLRDDFLGKIAQGEAMRRALAHVSVVRRLDAHHLREAVLRPLERVGYAWDDPAVVDAMVAELEGQPAALPLLQFACATLWERRVPETRRLRRADYQALGGVAGTLARHGEAVLSGLTDAQLDLARQILLRLVAPEGARRVVDREDALRGLPEEAGEVLERLCASRLVMAARPRDGRRAEAVLELAHESLIRTWSQLARWIDESTEERALLHEVEQAARLWDQRGRRPDEVWHGDALADVTRRLRNREGMSARAQDFVAESAAAEARARRRQRWLRGGLVGGLLVVTTVAVVVAWQAVRLADAAGDVGLFDLSVEPFDWNAEALQASTVDAARLPALRWELWDPDPHNPQEPGKPRDPAYVQVSERRLEGGRVLWRVQARSGPAFLRVTGRGADGQDCGPSWIRLRSLPGYAQRDKKQPQKLELVVPTCQATRAGMVEIPAGPFVYGGVGEPPIPGRLLPPPEQIVDLATFWIDRTEVANAAYAVYARMGTLTGEATPAYPNDDSVPGAGHPHHPATQLDAYLAETYCRYLGKRLPTTFEWTKAGRGGIGLQSSGASGSDLPRRNLPWGQPDLGKARIPLQDQPLRGSGPVSAQAEDRSPSGVLGLAGNVAEWTSSPVPGQVAAMRIIRGSDWSSSWQDGLHSLAVENSRHSKYMAFNLGFRCAR